MTTAKTVKAKKTTPHQKYKDAKLPPGYELQTTLLQSFISYFINCPYVHTAVNVWACEYTVPRLSWVPY